MTMKNEQAGGCTEDARALQHAEAAPPACVLDAKSADSQTAVARLVSISPGMSKLEAPQQATAGPFPNALKVSFIIPNLNILSTINLFKPCTDVGSAGSCY